MTRDDFFNLLEQWAQEDAYIDNLTWEEADSLSKRLADWYAPKHKQIIELKQQVLDLDRECQTGEFQNAKIQG